MMLPSFLRVVLVVAMCLPGWLGAAAPEPAYFPVPAGTHPHDVAPAAQADGPVYFTAQATGELGILDPVSGKTTLVNLGKGSAPHGVIMGPDGGVWITDGGQNAIVRYDPPSGRLKSWPLPAKLPWVNLNTATFDRQGRLWFTGQRGYHGRLNPANGTMQVWKSPLGPGPYGITTTPQGEVYYASLAGNHIARIHLEDGSASVIEPPTRNQGARRIWSDSHGHLWVSYWQSGHVARYIPATRQWREWPLPGTAHCYAVWGDEQDKVWLTEWSSNAILRFDPSTEKLTTFPSDRPQANVRQLQGRKGEMWGAESGQDRLVRIRSGF